MFKPRYIGVLFVALWILVHPLIIGADSPVLPARPPLSVEQQLARASALQRVRRESTARHLDYSYIQRRWTTKSKALQTLIKSAKSRQSVIDQLAARERGNRDQVTFAKARALAEARAIAQLTRERAAAEQQAIAAVIKQLEIDDPNFHDNALRQAKEADERGPGREVKELVDLPELEGKLPMTYLQYMIHRNPLSGGPMISARHINDEGVGKPLTEGREFDAAVQLEVSKREALKMVVAIAQRARDARKQQEEKTDAQRVKELVDKYLKNEITASEYYKERAKLRQRR